jgi:uncharacterized protein YqeY
MALKEQIKLDSTAALKSGDKHASETLRMLLSSILVKEKDKQYKTGKPELEEQEIIDVVSSEIKKRKDAIALYEQGNRPELAEKEKQEIEIIKKYLPEQLSKEEIKKLVQESIQKTGAKDVKDMGKVMGDLNPKIKGRADGAEVSKLVRELLTKN